VRARRSAGPATDREIAVVAAVLDAGSEKAAAHRLGPSHCRSSPWVSMAHHDLVWLAGMTVWRYAALMPGTKRKVTLYVDEDVLRAARVRAARTDKRDSEVVEAALRAYLGFEVVASVWARSDLGEDEAMRLAVEETHAVRAQLRAARGS